MTRKFELGRGIQYTQLFFWAFTISNVVMLNIREYLQIDVSAYIIIICFATIFIIFGVWLIGWVDVGLGFYSSERYQASIRDPVIKDIHDSTKRG